MKKSILFFVLISCSLVLFSQTWSSGTGLSGSGTNGIALNTICIIPTTTKVGIGTNNPTNPLSVIGNINCTSLIASSTTLSTIYGVANASEGPSFMNFITSTATATGSPYYYAGNVVISGGSGTSTFGCYGGNVYIKAGPGNTSNGNIYFGINGITTYPLSINPSNGNLTTTGNLSAANLTSTNKVGIGMAPLTSVNSKLYLMQGWGDWLEFRNTIDNSYFGIQNPQPQNRIEFYHMDNSGNYIFGILCLLK